MNININKLKKYLDEIKPMLNASINIKNDYKELHNYEKLSKNIYTMSNSFKEMNKDFTHSNKIFDNFSKSLKDTISPITTKHHQPSFIPSVILISYPLPGRQSVSLASSFNPHTKDTDIFLSYVALNHTTRHYKIGIMIGDRFIPKDLSIDDEESSISWYLLAKTVMFCKIVQNYEGPTYEEVQHDYFWTKFLIETEQLSAIAVVDSL